MRDGLSLFPDAPTTRGRRHLLALAHARREGIRAAVVFVVQRGDAAPFHPHDVADPAFGETLRQVCAPKVSRSWRTAARSARPRSRLAP